MDAKQTESAVERALSTFERAELVTKLAAASIPLTYISGYLIVTSYLGTYGLVLNSGDLFRAKYIYVGFEYLMFLTLVAAAFSVIARVAELIALIIREYKTPVGQSAGDTIAQQEKQKTAAYEVLRTRSLPINAVEDNFRTLRADFVVGLVVMVFALEVIFLNPEDLGGILPRQILYLMSVAIYQFTFYRELYEPYQWGLVHGRRWVEDLRWSLLLAQAFAAGSVLCRIAVNTMTAHQVYGWLRWTAYGLGWMFVLLAVEIDAIGAFSICARSKRLIKLDQDARFDPERMTENMPFGKLIWKSIMSGRSLRGILIAYFMRFREDKEGLFFTVMRVLYLAAFLVPLPFFVLHQVQPTYWNWLDNYKLMGGALRVWINLALETAPLFLSLLVLGNVSLLTSMVGLRDRRLKPKTAPFSLTTQPATAASNGPHKKVVKYARRVILAATLYIASVLGFGYIVYPFIPVQKAGGNYGVAAAPRVCVRLVNQTPLLSCSEDLLPKLKANEALVPLEEDSDSIYLAKDSDNGGPTVWSWGNVKGYKRPRVYAVSRKCVAGVVDALPATQADRCPR